MAQKLLTPKERLRLRMTEWLIRAGLPLREAEREAARWARSSLDPLKELTMMRDIESAEGQG